MGDGRKFVLPSIAEAGLPPKRSAYEADALGKGRLPGLKAILPGGLIGCEMGKRASPQISISESPALAFTG